MTRVLFLEALPTIAGGQQVLLDMLPALRDYELHALLPDPGPLSDALSAEGVACHFAPMARYTLVRKNMADMARFPFDQIRLAFRCARLARRLQADLLYANSSRTFIWGTWAAVLARRPVVWHLHNLLGDAKTLALIRRIGRWRSVGQVIAVSQHTAAQFPKLAHKTSVIPAGVDTTVFHPDPAGRERVRTEFNIPGGAPVVGSVGDLIPLKGQHTLIEAARLAPDGIHYLIVGSARPGDDESQTYVANLRESAGSNVIFTGRRDDLVAVLGALDILVITSERETGPLVLLYSLSCGVPVISTPVGRAPELIQAGVTGDFFPFGDAKLLSVRLSTLLNDRERLGHMGGAARRLAEDQLSLASFHTRIQHTVKRVAETDL